MLTRMTTPVCCSFFAVFNMAFGSYFCNFAKISRKSDNVVTRASPNSDCIERLSMDCCGSVSELLAG